MIDAIQTNPIAAALAVSLALNIVMTVVLTAMGFFMRGQTPPEIVAEVASMIPVDFLQSQLDRYEKLARENSDTNKELLAHLMRGSLNTLDAMQDAMSNEADAQ